MASWQWRDDKFVFNNFTAAGTAHLEKAWAVFNAADAAGRASPRVKCVTLTAGGQKYEINLQELSQRNLKTGTVRFLRRLDEHGAVATHAPTWEWYSNKAHKFIAYDAIVSEKIEKPFAESLLHCKVSVATGAHDAVPMEIHFGHMTQTNPATGTSRQIRRCVGGYVTKAAAAPSPAAATSAPAAPAPERKRAREVEVSSPSAAASSGPPSLRVDAGWTRPQPTLLLLNSHAGAFAGKSTFGIAGFDMDDTLVYPKSGATFPKSRSDWTWLHPSVVPTLQALAAAGNAVVIFTNQGGIGNKSWDEVKATEIRGKIGDLSAAAGVPISALVACKEDHLRKPGTEMWDLATKMIEGSNPGCSLDASRSFYVGDAAGRHIMTLAGRKKDFSCSDRKFARNVGVAFHTPEEYFLKAAPVAFDWDGIGPSDLDALRANKWPAAAAPVKGTTEMVLMMGFPGCGKSRIATSIFGPAGYAWINRDTLKTKEKCAASAAQHLRANCSVVIDNTNPTREDRKLFIDVAKAAGVPVRCLRVDATRDIANHMNIFRARLGISERVSSIAYNIFQKNAEEPTTAEGISEVIRVPVVLDFTGLPAGAEKLFFELS